MTEGIRECSESALHGTKPRRGMMRTSRIMAILVLLCFTFAGSLIVLAGDKKEIKIDNVKIEKEKDANGVWKIKKEGVEVPDNDIVDATLEDLIKDLEKNKEIQLITKENPTCYWYWNGTQWKKYCY